MSREFRVEAEILGAFSGYGRRRRLRIRATRRRVRRAMFGNATCFHRGKENTSPRESW